MHRPYSLEEMRKIRKTIIKLAALKKVRKKVIYARNFSSLMGILAAGFVGRRYGNEILNRPWSKVDTDRIILGWEYPASWLQILNPLFVVILAPFMSYLWIFLGKKMLDPSLPFKFGLGLIFMAIGFIVIAIGAQVALSQGLAGAKWLLLTYLFHTIGELILSPIGLAAISSLSPKRFIGQMMGVWFLASSLGAILAGLISGQATNEGLSSMPNLFNQIAIISSCFGLLLILIARPLQNWVFKKDL